MNIYCVIFMCTFGSNQTDTEISSHNLLASSNNTRTTDVASMILPERGDVVPQFGDIVMDLPDISNKNLPPAPIEAKSAQDASNKRVTTSAANQASPTLAEILLPPAPGKNPRRFS